jgi:hypothetical protein
VKPKNAAQLRRELNDLVLELDEICDDEQARAHQGHAYIVAQIERWRSRTIEWLSDNLGSRAADDFVDLQANAWGELTDWSEDREGRWRTFLLALEEDIRKHPDFYVREHPSASTLSKPDDDNDVRVASTILRRFHRFVEQLRTRHAGREALSVKNEYDVQDLLRALLFAYFEDVRPEEATPSCAGAGSRIDFLIPHRGIAIEVKVARSRRGDKAIGDELAVDILRYQKHTNCKHLFCLIYDPERHLSNPQGLINDLSRRHGDLFVTAVVSPAP